MRHVIVTFEDESRLAQIEEKCFEGCSTKSIWIPRPVRFIDASSLVTDSIRTISVGQSHSYFKADRGFIVDYINAIAG
jgi:hypothetical protein